ncbi:MAG: discoidin domain-containing protein, partial [Lachnospiraceae bacterium]|nr:discoidin domain-containing protein [Lachnospiraceae bacterium]
NNDNRYNPSFVWVKLATIEGKEIGESIHVDIKPRQGNAYYGVLFDTFVVTTNASFEPTDDKPLPDVDLGNTETKYTVRFIDYNNAELFSAQYVAGATIEIPSNPSRAEDEDYTYTFAGWKLYNETTGQVEGDFLASDATVTGVATYQAVYTATEKPINTNTGSFFTANGYVMFEAEDVRINTENDPTSADYDIKNDVVRVEEITGTTTATTASGEEAVRMRQRFQKDVSGNQLAEIAYEDYKSNLGFDVTVDQAGTYYIWARVAVYGKSYTSIWSSIDQVDYTKKSLLATSSNKFYGDNPASFVWVKLATIESKEVGDSIYVDFKPRQGKDEMGALIDAFVVTNTEYTVKFIDHNGAELSSTQYFSGATIELPDNPTRAEDKDYTYDFVGWKLYNGATGQVEGDFLSSDATVTGNTTYQAVYNATKKPADTTNGSFATTNGSVMFEAEDARINTENDPNATDYDAKNDVVRVEEIKGTTTATTAFGENAEAIQMRQRFRLYDADGNQLTIDSLDYSVYQSNLGFDVTVDVDSTYHVWARVAISGNSYKKIWLSTECSDYTNKSLTITDYYGTGNAPSFVWVKLAAIEGKKAGEIINIDIKSKQGVNSFGALFDAFVVTKNSSFVPTDAKTLPDDNQNLYVETMPSDVYKAPDITPPKDAHPRVMFTKNDIATIRANLTHPENAVAYEMFTNNKNAACDVTSSSIRSILAAKAFDYVINYDKNDPESDISKAALENGKEAVRSLKEYLATDMGLPTDTYAVYNSGYILLVAAEVYDWCYDLLTEEDKKEIVARCQATARDYMEIGCPPSKQSSVTSHGSENQLQRNWMALAIATYDEYPDIYNYVAGRYFEEYVPARNYFFESGGHWQGTYYGAKRFIGDLWSQILLCNMDKEDELTEVYVEEAAQVAYQWIYTRRPDSELLREGDDDFERSKDLSRIYQTTDYLFFLASNFYKDGVLKAEFLETATIAGGYAFLTEIQMLALNDPSIQTGEKAELPLAKYIGTPIGTMIARTGWNMGVTSPDVLAFMKIGEVQTLNHHHRDAGSFQIYYKGILASESGAYMSYNDPHNKIYNQASVAHNTLSITSTNNPTGVQRTPNGGGEYKTIASLKENIDDCTTGMVIGQEFGPDTYTPEYNYLAGDIAVAYDDNVTEAVRSMLFMPLEDEEHPAAFVVFDRITTTEANSTKSFLLHMQSEPTISGNVTVITNTEEDYNGMLTNQTLLPKNATITKIGGEGQQFMVGDVNYQPSDRFSLEPMEEGWGRVEISTTTGSTNQTDYMLNVMYVNDADQTLALEEAELIEADLVVGAKVFDRVAMFNKELVDKQSRIGAGTDVTFIIPADADVTSYKVNVAGLQSGTWVVKVNGNVVDTQISTDEGGIIYFSAPAGECTLTRISDDSEKNFTENKPTFTENINFRVNMKYVYTQVKPERNGEKLYLPVKALFEALKSEITSNADSASIDYLGNVIDVTNSRISITVPGSGTVETTDIKTVDGEFLVPVAFLAEALAQNMVIEWDEQCLLIEVTADLPIDFYDWSYHYPDLYPNAIKVKNVFCFENENPSVPISNALDGDLYTTWTVGGLNGVEMGVFDLGQVYTIDKLLLAVYKGTASSLGFAVEVSTDGINYTEAGSQKILYSSGTTSEFEEYNMYNVEARYVKLYGYGKGGGTSKWNAIDEIAFLGEAVPTIVAERTDTEYTLGTNGKVTIYCTGNYDKFESVKMDGNTVDASNYTVTKGSTVVEFKASYMETLADGEHTVTICYTNGKSVDSTLIIKAAATPTPGPSEEPTPTPGPSEEPTPAPDDTLDDDDEEMKTENTAETPVENLTANATPTGDNSNILLWYVLCLFVFAVSIIGINRITKKY